MRRIGAGGSGPRRGAGDAGPRTGFLGLAVAAARSLTPAERRRGGLMLASILALHLIGFGIFLVFVVPSHYKGLGIGVAALAYSLGLRHAFDADHISAIDNTTRKLISDGRRPLSVGYWFSLGHSSIVCTIGVAVVVAEKAVYGALSNHGSTIERFGGVFGTAVSAGFLYLIAALNIVILAGIVRVFRAIRHGEYDERELERHLERRGFMYRIFGRVTNAVDREWKMFPVGVLFGLGFDTATEVTLLATTALLASQHLPFYAIMCLPILFTAGMALMDTVDSIFMTIAYAWAAFNPVRRVYYNLAVTGLSVAICVVIGSVELLQLASAELGGLHSRLLTAIAAIDINKAGFVIVGLFVICWAGALVFWRMAGVEERCSPGARSSDRVADAVDAAP